MQSNYIPWKGYFDIINMVDEFVLYDDVQYTKNDWRNRNIIKTQSGTLWLTIPVLMKGRFGQNINETEIGDDRWASKHWKSLQGNYAKAGHFRAIGPVLRGLYEQAREERLLSSVNEVFTRKICGLLGFSTKISRSMDYELKGDRLERLVGLCEQAGANEYLTVPNTKAYLDEEVFKRAGISVRWMNYSGYAEYGQLFCPPFVHEVSIIDLLLNEGAVRAREFLLSTDESKCPSVDVRT